MGCVLCDADSRRCIRDSLPPPPSTFVPQKPRRDGSYSEGLCGACQSRGRVRAMAILLERSAPFVRRNAPVLVVSAGRGVEFDLFQRMFSNPVYVTLLDDGQSYPRALAGVDLNDLSRFPARAFQHAIAINVLDYIPTVDIVFQQMHRVLRRGGTFLFSVQPSRLGSFDVPVRVRSSNALKTAPYVTLQPDGSTGIPDCQFDRSQLLASMQKAGFTAEIISIPDDISELRFEIFAGRA